VLIEGKQMKILSVRLFFPPDDISKITSYVKQILESGMLTMGEFTREFEKEFSEYLHVKYAVAVSSGTAALEIALRSQDLKSGDEVIVPTNTFTATAAAVFFAGGKPVLVDVDPNTLCIDTANFKKALTDRTKGVMAVHMGGLICPQIDEIAEICRKRNIFLIEDAAHAHGSLHNGQAAGSFGDVGCYSFYPTKVMTTAEGGMVVTNDETVATRAKILRDQGKKTFSGNDIVELGYNWRINEISAAIGSTQLERLPEIIRGRNAIAKIYNQGFAKSNHISPLKIPAGDLSNYYKYVAFLRKGLDRGKFKQNLREKGVSPTGEVYWPPLHLQPIYQKLLGTKPGDLPISEDYCSRMVCLPIYPQLSREEAQYVVDSVLSVLKEM
jgi:dTDP-4-amino-4,6-dideoxygalactose transaminase